MTQPRDPVITTHAQKLLDGGWCTNMAEGSVTRKRDERPGLVDYAVWEAMKHLQAETWSKTEPQPFAPTGTWESQAK
jgi:hypothetical protein